MGLQNSKLSSDEFNEILNGTKFSSEEINEWFKRFKNDFPRGNIRRYQFMVIYTRMFPNGDAAEFTDHIFRTYDLDEDGTIDFREFIVTLSVASRGTPEEKLKWAFRLYDINGNGVITMDELESILLALYRARNQPQAKEEAKKVAADIMKDLDTDRNGSISESEFVAGATNYPNIKDLIQGKI